MSIYIPCTDGYYYKISENQDDRRICVKRSDGEHYTVHPDRYIIGMDGYLYKITGAHERNTITIIGRNNQKYIVKNKKISFSRVRFNLDDHKCSGPSPLPIIKFDGEGDYDCNQDTGVCNINAPKGTKVFVGAPKGWDKIFDSNRVWLRKTDE